VILVPTIEASLPLVDASPPSMSSSPSTTPRVFLARMRNAGAVFLRPPYAEVIGDYVGGSNHVLPTAPLGTLLVGPVGARFRQAHLDPEARAEQLRRWRRQRLRSPRREGLDAHGRSVAIRLNMWRHGGRRSNRARLIDVELDESIGRSTPDVEHERAVAIFRPDRGKQFSAGQRRRRRALPARLSLAESRLVFAVRREGWRCRRHHILSLTRSGASSGLLFNLRKLLRRHPLLDAEPYRGVGHGPARPAQ